MMVMVLFFFVAFSAAATLSMARCFKRLFDKAAKSRLI